MKEVTLEQLEEYANGACGAITKVYLHWSAGKYDSTFNDYHINITGDGKIYMSTIDLYDLLPHTWQRNTGAVGVALCCCYGAVANEGYNADFGDYPPTKEQVESMAKVVAVLSKALGLEINPDNFMTHCEAATEDGYGPHSGDPETRWDLWYLPDFDGEMREGGVVIRGKALFYLSSMLG